MRYFTFPDHYDMRKLFMFLCSTLFFCTLCIQAQSSLRTISYQGYIAMPDNKPLQGQIMIHFMLFADTSQKVYFWNERQYITAENGYIQAQLGSFEPLPKNLPDQLYLALEINYQRLPGFIRLSAVPYAITSETASALVPGAKGAVLSLNGVQGDVQLKGENGIEIKKDAMGGLIVGMQKNALEKGESTLNQGTEWLLAGNNNASSTSWLGTGNNIPLIIKTNNLERARILSSGNMGIGVTNPAYRLAVSKELAITNDNGAPEFRIQTPSNSNFTVFKTGNQSSTITYTLPISAGSDGDVLSTDGTGNLTWSASTMWRMNGNNNLSATSFIGSTNNQPFILRTNNVERMRISSTGAIGIGTDAPAQRLEVLGNILIRQSGSNTGELRLQSPNSSTYTAFRAGAQNMNITYTLPPNRGISGEVLTSDGNGGLSWTTISLANTILSGDIIGPISATTVSSLRGIPLSSGAPATGNLLKFDGTEWTPSAERIYTAGSGISIANDIITNTGDLNPLDDILTSTTAGGDITGTFSALSIVNNAVNSLHIADGSIVNADINASAAIAYAKLSLGSSIVNSDISPTAAIDYSKLNIANSIINADINASAAIAYAKLSLGSSIVNSDISPTAAIDYSKLNIANSITNADINASAAIAYAKLSLGSSIVNSDISPTAAIAYSKLNIANSITNADINASAAIAYAKLSLGSSIVNSDISPTAAIAYSKLNIANSITNADINASAAIAYAKLSLGSSIVNSDISPTAAIAYSKLNIANSITNADINASAAIAYAKMNLANSIVNNDISPTAAIAYSKLNIANSITNADINASAAIAYTKLNLTGSIATTDIADNAVNGNKIAMGSDAAGDLIYYDGSNYARLPIGSNGQVLSVQSGIPAWSAGASGGLTLPYTASQADAGALFSIENTDPAGTAFRATGGSAFTNFSVNLENNNNTANELRFYEPSGSGTNYTAFRAAAQSANITYTLPNADGSTGQVLSTNGAGQLSWTTAVTNGSAIQLAYQTVPSGSTALAGAAVIHVQDNATASNAATLSLPGSGIVNGQVMIVSTADPDGAVITYGSGLTFAVSSDAVIRFVRVAGVWKPEF
jgi:hypothetical protein